MECNVIKDKAESLPPSTGSGQAKGNAKIKNPLTQLNKRINFFANFAVKLLTHLHKILIKQHLRLRGGQPVAVRYFVILTSQRNTCKKAV